MVDKIQSTEASSDDSITYEQNVAGALSPVLTKKVQSPFQYVLVNTLAMRVDARDGSDNKIKDGDAVVGVSPPDSETIQAVDERDLRTYGDLSFTEQREDKFSSQVQYEVESGELVVDTDYEFGIFMNSDTQINTSNSFFELEAQREQAE